MNKRSTELCPCCKKPLAIDPQSEPGAIALYCDRGPCQSRACHDGADAISEAESAKLLAEMYQEELYQALEE